MSTWDDAVRQFHRAIGAGSAERPQLLRGVPEVAIAWAKDIRAVCEAARQSGESGSEFSGRLALVMEELAEWIEAHAQGDLVAAADAWADRMYVLLGDAVAAGLPTEALFAEVHRSNMTKAAGRTNLAGKAVKAADFEKPQIRKVLEAACPGCLQH